MPGQTGSSSETPMRQTSIVRSIARLATTLLAELTAIVGTTGIIAAQRPAPTTKNMTIRIADSTRVRGIRLREASSIVGRVTEVGPDTIRFAATGGTLSLTRADIV